MQHIHAGSCSAFSIYYCIPFRLQYITSNQIDPAMEGGVSSDPEKDSVALLERVAGGSRLSSKVRRSALAPKTLEGPLLRSPDDDLSASVLVKV